MYYLILNLTQLPLFRACVHEILRISYVVQIGDPHSMQSYIPITTNNDTKYTNSSWYKDIL